MKLSVKNIRKIFLFILIVSIMIIDIKMVSAEQGQPGPVNGLTAVPSSYNSVTLTWDTVEEADFYAVYRSESENGTYKLLTNTLTTNTFTSKSLACGTTYYYKVKAGKAINGTKVWGDESSIVSATPKLSAPTGVTATPSSSSTVDMHWEKVEGAQYYQVYRMPSPNGKLALLGVYDENTFNSVSRKLGANTTYYYKVRCYRWVNGERVFSPFSTVVSATTFLKKPSNVKVVANTYNSVTITWDNVSGSDFYAVYRSETKDGTYKLLTNTLTVNSFTSKSLACGTTYYYKVKAGKTIDGTKVWGDESSIVSATPKLSAPTGVIATPTTSSAVHMRWEKVEGAQYYQVYRMPSPNGKLALLGVYDENTFESMSRKLAADTTYYYKVRCYRWVNGERVFSPFSSIVSATTKNHILLSDTIEIINNFTLKETYGYTRFLVLKNISNEPLRLTIKTTARDANDNAVDYVENSYTYLEPNGVGMISEYYDEEGFNTIEYGESEYEFYYTYPWHISGVRGISLSSERISDGCIVTAKNTTNNAVEFVEVGALFFNDGEIVGFDYGYTTNDDCVINPGSTESTKLSCYEEFDYIEIYFMDGYVSED